MIWGVHPTSSIVINMTPLNTPSFTPHRPMASTQRVSLTDQGPRPMGAGSWMGLSGHQANRVPSWLLPTSSLHTPLITTSFRPSGAMGAPMRGKTRPSYFQKWVKKYNGSGDPYDHLASVLQVVRDEEVTDLHVLKEGFGLTLEGKALSWFQTLDIGSYYSSLKPSREIS